MKKIIWMVFSIMIICCCTSSYAQDKVVVIPLTKSLMADFYPSENGCVGIPDNWGIPNKIEIPASAGVIKKLEVVLFISHDYNGDLDVHLTHDNKETVYLFSDIDSTGRGIFVHFDDNAKTDIGSAPHAFGKPLVGIFNPEGNETLASFNGTDATGIWTLVVWDDATIDTGTLYSWGLYIVD